MPVAPFSLLHPCTAPSPPFVPFCSGPSPSPPLSLPLMIMLPPPSFTPTPALVARVEVVTLTVTSGSSTPTSQPSSGGGSSSVPIAAIVGGVAGGVTLAVLVVLVWKYWGLVIKRDERQRRKEAVRVLVSYLVTGGLTAPCSKTCLPYARTQGGTRRRVSNPNRSTAPCSRSIPTAVG